MNEHDNFSDAFPDEVCGIGGNSTIYVVDNLRTYDDGAFLETSRFKLVFTAANGKSVTLFAAGNYAGPLDPIDNGDGTITFVRTIKGVPEKLSLTNGRTLSRDAGVVTLSETFQAVGDDLDFLSRTVSGEHGPHPDLASDFALFCDKVAPELV